MILAIDQGTSSTATFVVAPNGTVAGQGRVPIAAHHPRPGWVEQDAAEIWRSVQRAARLALANAGNPPLAAIGLTNQRETAVAWDARSGRPLAPAIVWQDRRTAQRCEALREAGWGPRIRSLTGLTIDPYFSATAYEWLLTNSDSVGQAAQRGTLRLGTVDAWIVWNLTGGAHVTDLSNASRTMLMDLSTQAWSNELLELFGVPHAALPMIVDSAGEIARTTPSAGVAAGTPITGLAGDQQAALFGHLAHAPGDIKVTYGTGGFLLQVAGTDRPEDVPGLLTTVAWRREGRVTYAREGSVFVAGAVIQWLRDGLRLISHAAECEVLARRVPNAAGAVIVPAFAGLGTPIWDPLARGAIVGLTAAVSAEHLCRAALEAIAHQIADVLDVMAPSDAPLRVDGGAAASDLLLELQANIAQRPVVRPAQLETTALGAAYLAGLAAGVWGSAEEIRQHRPPDRVIDVPGDLGAVSRDTWRAAVDRARRWAPSEESTA